MHLDLPNLERGVYVPKLAIVISKNDLSGTLVTEHQCDKDDNKNPIIGAGRPVSAASLNKLLQITLTPDSKSFKPVESNVIATSADGAAWFIKGGVKPMWFTPAASSGKKAKRLMVPWPNLVCAYNSNRGLSVWAVKRKTKPPLDVPLYNAPLMNIYSHGGMCFGSATLAKNKPPIEAREASLFESKFSHTNHSQTIKGKGGTSGLYALYAQLHQKRAQSFPNQKLVPAGITLGEALEAL